MGRVLTGRTRAAGRRGGRASAWLVMAGLCTLVSGTGRAENMQSVLQRMTPYDVHGQRSLEALGALSAMAGRASSEEQQAVLSFVHTMASVDLWLIGNLQADAALHGRLADQFGVEPAALPNLLAQALQPLRSTSYRASVDDALSALTVLSTAGASIAVPSGEGTRTSLAFLLRATAPVENEREALALLAQLSGDPCPRPDACEGLAARFDAAGRRAVASLERAARAWKRLTFMRDRDPLVEAVTASLDERYGRLQALPLSPGVRFTRGPVCTPAAGCGAPGRLDVVVYVEANRVRIGRAPQVQVDADGAVQLVPSAGPTWPETTPIDLPRSLPLYLRPLRSLTEALSALRGDQEGMHIGVGAAAGTRAHVWARVMLSARAAGFTQLSALGRSQSGQARLQPVRVVTALAAPKLSPGELNVMMRMKGYSVKRRGPTMTIDRVPTDDGSYRFDLAALVERAQPAQAHSAHLRFMPDVAADALLNTAFAVAPQDAQVTLILP